MIVGVTSSMGGGATTVAKMLKGKLVSADEIARKVLQKKEVKLKLVKAFGRDILTGKKISRKRLAALAFKDKKSLKKLNTITHPLILKEIRNQLRAKKKAKLVVLDAPLLVESGLAKDVDKVILVRASRETQLKRLMQKHFSREQALQRIKAHYALSRKARQADFLVENNGPLKETRAQVNAILDELGVST